MSARLIGCGIGLLLAFGPATSAQSGRGQRVAEAKPGEMRLLVTAAIRTPLDAVRAEAEQAIGRPLVIEYGSARGNLKQAILAGQGFDVAMLLPDVDDELLKAGQIARAGVEIARVPIAIGVRGEVPSIDLSTPEAVKQAMLNAKSLRWSPTGAALLTVNKMLDTLGIREAAAAKHNMPAPVPLGPGDYELNIYPQSEILENAALRNRGPVIAALQVPAIITAVVAADTKDVTAAKALIAFLQGPMLDPALETSGMSR